MAESQTVLYLTYRVLPNTSVLTHLPYLRSILGEIKEKGNGEASSSRMHRCFLHRSSAGCHVTPLCNNPSSHVTTNMGMCMSVRTLSVRPTRKEMKRAHFYMVCSEHI